MRFSSDAHKHLMKRFFLWLQMPSLNRHLKLIWLKATCSYNHLYTCYKQTEGIYKGYVKRPSMLSLCYTGLEWILHWNKKKRAHKLNFTARQKSLIIMLVIFPDEMLNAFVTKEKMCFLTPYQTPFIYFFHFEFYYLIFWFVFSKYSH